MQFIVFIGVALLLAILTTRRPVVPVVIAIGIYTSSPWIASGMLTGGGLGGIHLSAATYFVLLVMFIQFIVNLRDYTEDLLRAPVLNLSLGAFVAAALIFTYFGIGSGGIPFVVDQVMAPIALFLMIRRTIDGSAANGARLARAYITFAVINAVVAVLVYSGLLSQPYHDYLATYYWYSPDFTRALGLTDHPLVLASILAAAIPLLVALKHSWLQAVYAVLFVVVILLAEARTALFLAAVAIGFLIVRGAAPMQTRLALLVALVAAGLFYVNTALSEGISEKLSDDNGSGQVRTLALEYTIGHLDRWILSGSGTGSNAAVALEAGLRTSLENPFAAYVVDYSLAAAVLYFGAQIAIVAQRRSTDRPVPGSRLAALVTLAAVQAYMSLATINYSGGLLWIVLAFAAAPQARPRSSKATPPRSRLPVQRTTPPPDSSGKHALPSRATPSGRVV